MAEDKDTEPARMDADVPDPTQGKEKVQSENLDLDGNHAEKNSE